MENEKKYIYPEQLIITIRTSIPGFQKFFFKPYMLIKNIQENNIQFNPLIKLNSSKINEIPKEFIPKCFFNKSLFNSLIVKKHEYFTFKNILQATQNENIDNNIKITLDNLFPTNSIIYIGSKTYVIVDAKWTTGEWNIEIIPNIETNKIKIAKHQIDTLPKSILYGYNFKTNTYENEDNFKTNTYENEDNFNKTYNEEKIMKNIKDDLIVNKNSTNFFINYFGNNNFYILLNNVFVNFPENIKNAINKFYEKTNYEKNSNGTEQFNFEIYKKSCQQVNIIQSPTDGDCFFKAVADGINIYNYENQTNEKIIYSNIYGNSQLFTIRLLREIVLNYINTLNKNEMLDIAKEQLENLNKQFKKSIDILTKKQNGTISQSQYMDELNNVYKSNPNFLIYKPKKIPIYIEEYFTPFRVLEINEIPNYIKSKDYWANEVAIEAICKILNISIISIEKYKVGKKQFLKSLITNNTLIGENCSNKIMFLYYYNNHYELIQFNYKIKDTNSKLIQNTKSFSIFKLKELTPPFHILMLIYSTIYIWLSDESKQNFNIYNNIMKNIHNSVIQIMNNPFQSKDFIKLFDELFQNSNKLLNLRYVENDKIHNNKMDNYDEMYNYDEIKGGNNDISYLTYAITIELELQPGTNLTSRQLSESKCNSKYNSIKKYYSEFLGKPYIIKPVYNPTKKTGGKKYYNKTKKII